MDAPAPVTPAQHPRDAGVPPKPWGIPAIAIALAIPVLLWAATLALVAAEGTPEDLSSGEIIANLVLQIIILDGIFIGAPALIALARHRLGWEALGFRSFDRDHWWLPVVAAAGAHVAIIIYSSLLYAFGAEDAAPRQEDLDELFQSRAVLPLTGVATVIAAPFAEEIFFRGFIFAGLIRPLGVFWAMVVSGTVFAAFHVTSPETVGVILPFAAVGIVFAWLYQRTGSLWPSVFAHLLFNGVSFVLLASLAGSNGS